MNATPSQPPAHGPDDAPGEHRLHEDARETQDPRDARDPSDRALRERVALQAERLRRARKAGLLGLLVTGGTAGLLFTVPLVLGAYLGRWIDEMAAGYSVRWTVNCILLGLALGVANVIFFFRDHGR